MRLALNADVEQIAARMVAGNVAAVAQAVRDAAAALAPPAKQWITVEDERVRRSHRRAHNQRCPANIPYILSAPSDDGSTLDAPGSGTEYPMEPRDPVLSPANRYNCRCQSFEIPGIVGSSLTVGPVRVEGTTVSVSVYTEFERAGESETAQVGGGWLLAGARTVAAERRA